MTKFRAARVRFFHRQALPVALVFFVLSSQPHSVRAETVPQVQLAAGNAGPRTLEALTQESVVRQYGHAWQNLSDAFEYSLPEALNDYFVGAVKDQLLSSVADQQKVGMRSRYVNQRHKIDVVFYAPEGDVLELHDTMECELQVFDGEKSIHNEPTILHYVVLMTPGADRWVIRQLQAVSQF